MFSTTYEEARTRFLESARAVGAEHGDSYQHPLRGPQGQKLFLDVVAWGASTAAQTLVLTSGTHGIEGFVGSAIQTSLLEGRFGSRPADIRILLVHALNPYGFAWYRRANEDGVDLNRNFINFASPPSNPEFTDALATALVPTAWGGREDEELRGWIAIHGIEGLKRIIPAGQYEHWFAPFYGGRAPTWSNVMFSSIIERHLEGCRNITLIDYHSGLGERGTGQLIARGGADGAEVDAGSRFWGAAYVGTTEEKTVAYKISGDTPSALHDRLPRGALMTCAAHEFGTLPELAVLKAIRFDHFLHVHGDIDAAHLVDQKAFMREAFCPTDVPWEDRVLEQAGWAITNVFNAAA